MEIALVPVWSFIARLTFSGRWMRGENSPPAYSEIDRMVDSLTAFRPHWNSKNGRTALSVRLNVSAKHIWFDWMASLFATVLPIRVNAKRTSLSQERGHTAAMDEWSNDTIQTNCECLKDGSIRDNQCKPICPLINMEIDPHLSKVNCGERNFNCKCSRKRSFISITRKKRTIVGDCRISVYSIVLCWVF